MLFSSTVFLVIFLPATIFLYFFPLIKNRTYKNVILLTVSIIFYAWGEPLFIFLMMLSTIFNWVLAKKVFRKKNQNNTNAAKIYMIIAVVFDLGILLIFKYLTFLLDNLGMLIGKTNSITIALPIGISFFTFQILSYVIDVYKGKVCAQNKLYKFALYILMFPPLIAGPIVRYSLIEEKLDYREESAEKFVKGMCRFIFGLSKKMLIANHIAVVADNMFYLSKNTDLSIASSWLGAIAYMIQIYYDFSGYSDMAIGLGSIFGFQFPENFNYPYMSRNITEFWKRWHITLSEWFRDYLYIPLGGNRVGNIRKYLNLFWVWVLTGLWHGANWTFILWGLGYFILISFERIYQSKNHKQLNSRVYTLICVCLLWVIFRADGVYEGVRYISQMFGAGNHIIDSAFIECMKSSWRLLIISLIFIIPIKDKFRVLNNKYSNEVLPLISSIPLLLICLSKCILAGYSPFIYFNF